MCVCVCTCTGAHPASLSAALLGAGGNKGTSYRSPLTPSQNPLTLKPTPGIFVLCLLFPKPSSEAAEGHRTVPQWAEGKAGSEASSPPSPARTALSCRRGSGALSCCPSLELPLFYAHSATSPGEFLLVTPRKAFREATENFLKREPSLRALETSSSQEHPRAWGGVLGDHAGSGQAAS